ncbi:MAG: tellurite resistance TerB family protein [Myxococcota bacterium]
MATQPQQQALIEVMVVGAQIAGGLSPDRADALLTITLEHSDFSGLEEDDLRAMLEEAITQARPTRLPTLSQAVAFNPTLAFQLMFLVAREGGALPQDALLDAATTFGLSPDDAQQIIDAGVPPALAILDAAPAPEEAYLDVLLAAAASDGEIAEQELEKLIHFAGSRMELRLLPREEIEDLMTASLQGFLDHGFSAWLETLPASLPTDAQRQTAYKLAAEMIEADQQITDSERAFMAQLRAVLELQL